MTRHVLMVDDEVDVVWSMERQIRRERPDISFQGSNDPEDALARIRARVPDLLVTDVRMPKMSGLELIVAARAVAPALPVVVITAYGSAEVRREVRNFSSVDYLDKPFSFKELLERIDRSLGAEEGFSGSVSVSFPDIIQLYALSMASGALHVTRGGEEATLWFDVGELVHATLGPLRGEAAVYRLLGWKGGAFQLTAGARAGERSITSSWQEILIEGCRQLDEAQVRATSTGSAEMSEPPFSAAEMSETFFGSAEMSEPFFGAAEEAWNSFLAEAGNPSWEAEVVGVPREGGAVVRVSGSLGPGPGAVEPAVPVALLKALARSWAADWIEALGSGIALAFLQAGERGAYDFLSTAKLTDANGGPRFRRSLAAFAKVSRRPAGAGEAAVSREPDETPGTALDEHAAAIVRSIAGARA
ncbi:MAG: response regulator, partial [Acidobacteria bacterium]|nr:response regulator [Acidobacteriota bacterium]